MRRWLIPVVCALACGGCFLFHKEEPIPDSRPGQLVLAVDRTPSMALHDERGRARDYAGAIAALLPPGWRLTCLTIGEETEAVVDYEVGSSSDRRKILGYLQPEEGGAGANDLSVGVKSAVEAALGKGSRVVVISDGGAKSKKPLTGITANSKKVPVDTVAVTKRRPPDPKRSDPTDPLRRMEEMSRGTGGRFVYEPTADPVSALERYVLDFYPRNRLFRLVKGSFGGFDLPDGSHRLLLLAERAHLMSLLVRTTAGKEQTVERASGDVSAYPPEIEGTACPFDVVSVAAPPGGAWRAEYSARPQNGRIYAALPIRVLISSDKTGTLKEGGTCRLKATIKVDDPKLAALLKGVKVRAWVVAEGSRLERTRWQPLEFVGEEVLRARAAAAAAKAAKAAKKTESPKKEKAKEKPKKSAAGADSSGNNKPAKGTKSEKSTKPVKKTAEKKVEKKVVKAKGPTDSRRFVCDWLVFVEERKAERFDIVIEVDLTIGKTVWANEQRMTVSVAKIKELVRQESIQPEGGEEVVLLGRRAEPVRIVYKNMSSLPLTLEMEKGEQGVYVDGLPAELPPGGTAEIGVRFNTSGLKKGEYKKAPVLLKAVSKRTGVVVQRMTAKAEFVVVNIRSESPVVIRWPVFERDNADGRIKKTFQERLCVAEPSSWVRKAFKVQVDGKGPQADLDMDVEWGDGEALLRFDWKSEPKDGVYKWRMLMAPRTEEMLKRLGRKTLDVELHVKARPEVKVEPSPVRLVGRKPAQGDTNDVVVAQKVKFDAGGFRWPMEVGKPRLVEIVPEDPRLAGFKIGGGVLKGKVLTPVMEGSAEVMELRLVVSGDIPAGKYAGKVVVPLRYVVGDWMHRVEVPIDVEVEIKPSRRP